jgi:hypothetical protein
MLSQSSGEVGLAAANISSGEHLDWRIVSSVRLNCVLYVKHQPCGEHW